MCAFLPYTLCRKSINVDMVVLSELRFKSQRLPNRDLSICFSDGFMGLFYAVAMPMYVYRVQGPSLSLECSRVDVLWFG
jgi:hypothetical protein